MLRRSVTSLIIYGRVYIEHRSFRKEQISDISNSRVRKDESEVFSEVGLGYATVSQIQIDIMKPDQMVGILQRMILSKFDKGDSPC